MKAMKVRKSSLLGVLVALAVIGTIVGGDLWGSSSKGVEVTSPSIYHDKAAHRSEPTTKLAAQGVPLKPDFQENTATTEIREYGPTNKASLPALPKSAQLPERSMIPGVSNWAPPTRQYVDPDASKSLLGFYGPYFNVRKLDGEVLVLDDTVYVWPLEHWHATGLIRNQSLETIRIINITVRLLGSNGEALDVATATVPVEEIRPGEPAPFEVITPIPRSNISEVDWHVEYMPSETALRTFELEIYQSAKVPAGNRYLLSGSIRNLTEATMPNVRVVAAWLNNEGRILYVAPSKVQSLDDQAQLEREIDLEAGGVGHFFYETSNAKSISLLSQARLVLWGVSK